MYPASPVDQTKWPDFMEQGFPKILLGKVCLVDLELPGYLEDHPRTCKWLITMVSPLNGGYSSYKWPFLWLVNGGY